MTKIRAVHKPGEITVDMATMATMADMPVTMTVENQRGQTMLRASGNSGEALRLNIRSLEPGLYFLCIDYNGETICRRFLKE